MTGTLYVEPDTNAARQAKAWRTTDPAGAALMDRIAAQPQATWLGHEWVPDPAATVDAAVTVAKGALRVFVVYDIPGRDAGYYSAGGAGSALAYWRFVAGVARGLRGRRAIVIVEPDALALAEQERFTAAELATRQDMLAAAVDTLTGAGARTYLDAGDSNWIPADRMAALLTGAGVAKAAGFATNVSHYELVENEVRYAGELRKRLGTGVRFVVDTSRCGRGPDPAGGWCNWMGAGLGPKPTLATRVAGCDAFVWAKRPGESDGPCNGGPPAGHWWPEYARGLAERAVG